jgi:thiol-disulfide isomerase/thioredoxin
MYYKKNGNNKYLFIICFCLIIAGRFLIMPSYTAYLLIDKIVNKYKLSNLALKDDKGQLFDNQKFLGKTVVLDVWTTSCAQCIRKFPKLELLNENYKNDSSIIIVSLNLPLDRNDDYKLAIDYSSPFKFQKLFYDGLDGFEKMKINSVPTLLIFNKEQQCIYAGDLNVEWNVFIGNVNRILKSITSEK